MREPWFWRIDTLSAKAVALALTPFAAAYQAGQRLRWMTARPVRAGIPVICIGNASLGGAGKTPFALMIEAMLRAEGVKSFFLTRGHGGAERGPLLVDPQTHSSADVGDEALLLARRAPTVVARNRPRGAELARRSGADLVIMDDGFQNPSLLKDLSVLLIGAHDIDDSRKTFPAGPYRETVKRAMSRAEVIVTVGGEENAGGGLPDFHAWLAPSSPPAPEKVFAFAGIGNPERFFSMLESLGYDVAESAAFPDHHAFSETELKLLSRKAARLNARLICTEKDFVRLPASFRDDILMLPVDMRVNDPEALKRRLMDCIAAARKHGDNGGDG